MITQRAKARSILKKKLMQLSTRADERKQIDILFSNRCLFRCGHCFHWTNKNYLDSLKLGQWLSFLEDLSGVYGTEVELNLGGDGMALLNPYVFPILKKSSSLGFYTALNSNGFLINNSLLQRLAESGLDKLSMSLDFPDPTKHDMHRGVRYAYDHVLNILDYIKGKNFNLVIQLNCVIMAGNLDEIIDLAEFVQGNSQVDTLIFQAISHPMSIKYEKHWYRSARFRHLWPSDKQKVNEVLDRLIELKRQGSKISNPISQLIAFKKYFMDPEKCITGLKCNVRDIGLHVFNEGRTKVCPFKDSIGSIKDGTIKDLLGSDQAKRVNEQMDNCSDNCHQLINCKFTDDSVFNMF